MSINGICRSLNRIATRGEFSDLMWEMQGENSAPHMPMRWVEIIGVRRITHKGFSVRILSTMRKTVGIVSRTSHMAMAWEVTKDSPLNAPGINIREGDVLLAIAGQRVSETVSPGELLVKSRKSGSSKRRSEVRTMVKNVSSRLKCTGKRKRAYGIANGYRKNRRYVHEKTDGKVGYVHIPDMGRRGYAEFHRGFLAEVSYPGLLLVDVRYNGGGHVSQLLLEKVSLADALGMTFRGGGHHIRIQRLPFWVRWWLSRTRMPVPMAIFSRTVSN